MPSLDTLPMHHRLLRVTAIGLLVAIACACSKKPVEPAAQSAPIVFKAQASIPVTLSLLQGEGQSGRTSPIGSNYRPQVRFPLGSLETGCTVRLPVEAPSLDPGRTSSADLTCDAEVRVERTRPEFAVFEGGKPVGNGTVRLP